MAEQAATADATPADATATPQAGGQVSSAQAAQTQQSGSNTSTDTQAGGDADGETSDGDNQPMTLAEARKLRRENKSLRQKNEEFENAKLSDQERSAMALEKANADVARLTAENRRLMAIQALGTAGARYPELLVNDIPDDALEDKASRDRWIADRKKSYPDLFRVAATTVDANAQGDTPKAGGGMNSFIRRAAGREQ